MREINLKFNQLLARLYPEAEKFEFSFDPAPASRFAELTCSAAFKLAGKLGKSPDEIAQEIVQNFDFAEIESASWRAGFINIIPNRQFYAKQIGEIARQER